MPSSPKASMPTVPGSGMQLGDGMCIDGM
jgi:hypothetical protein